MRFVKHGLIAMGLALGGWTLAAQSAPEVVVTGGRIRGEHLAEGGASLKGIPYAQPPTGGLRWREPMPVRAWTGTRDAMACGAICPKNSNATIPNAPELLSEDCLYLNIWTHTAHTDSQGEFSALDARRTSAIAALRHPRAFTAAGSKPNVRSVGRG